MTNMAKKKPKRLKLTDQIRQAIEDCGETRYQIWKATSIDNATLCRFVSGERGLSMEALDTLAEYLELDIISRRSSKGTSAK